MSRLYCIDASIYIFRAYFAYPDRWFSPEGYSVNAVYGYLQFLLKLLAEERPAHLMAAFDESLGSGFRHRIDPDYKGNRVLPDEALAFQLAACRRVTEALGIACFAGGDYEADDYIAAAARLARRRRLPVTVVTRDKDLAQVLHRADDQWWDVAGDRRLHKAEWEARAGIRTDQVADWLALVGDSIDAIPGVPGVGAVTATRLLQHFDNLDRLYSRLERLPQSGIRGAAALQGRLAAYEQQVRRARQLTGLLADIDELRSLRALRYRLPPADRLGACLRGLGFDTEWCDRLVRKPPFGETG